MGHPDSVPGRGAFVDKPTLARGSEARMRTLDLVRPNRYQDSVTLMQVAVKLRAIEGIEDASLMMGTEPNKEMLHDAGLLMPEGRAAGPNDLIVALRGTQEAVGAVAGQLEALLQGEVETGKERRQ